MGPKSAIAGIRNTGVRLMWYWLPPALWCAVIFLQSSFSAPKALPDWPFADKVVHAGVYAMLAALFCRAFGSIPALKGPAMRWVVSGVAAATLYGALDEWHKSFVPARTADPMDLLADLVGAMTGGLLYLWGGWRPWGRLFS